MQQWFSVFEFAQDRQACYNLPHWQSVRQDSRKDRLGHVGLHFLEARVVFQAPVVAKADVDPSQLG